MSVKSQKKHNKNKKKQKKKIMYLHLTLVRLTAPANGNVCLSILFGHHSQRTQQTTKHKHKQPQTKGAKKKT